MPLTEKEKRIIASPLSFSSNKRKTTKFRARKKIQEILCDMQFLIENNSKIFEEFGIDVLSNISKHISTSETVNSKTDTPEDKPSKDPDLL